MYSDEIIERRCGPSALKYLKNKNKGGRANAKGHGFESFYASYKIAKLAEAVVGLNQDGSDIEIESQGAYFIDDLVVHGPNLTTYSQLKAGAVSWTAGEHPIKDDFELQQRLDQGEGRVAAYELVVADRDLKEKLADGREGHLEKVDVVYFRNSTALSELFEHHPDLKTAIDGILLSPVKDNKREWLWKMLNGAWMSVNGRDTLQNILNSIDSAPFALIGRFGPLVDLPDDVAAILRQIEGFHFHVQRNRLFYECKGIEGWAAWALGTEQAEEFYRFVRERQPQTFSQLHEALRRGQ